MASTIARLTTDVLEAPAVPRLRVDLVRRDGGTQMRFGLSELTIFDYADDMRLGHTFPPVVVFYDGTAYWLADGFHRVAAVARLALDTKGTPQHEQWTTISVDVRAGSVQDAVRFSISANRASQLRRTNEDKQIAVRAALAHPAMQGMSARAIAREVGVDCNMVLKQQKRVSFSDTNTQPPKTTQTKAPKLLNITQNTSNDGDVTAQKRTALDLAAKGMRPSDIASAVGRSASTVKDWIKDPESAPSTRGLGGGAPRKIIDADVARLFDEGMSVAEVAKKLGVSDGSISAARRRLGLGRSGKRAKNPLIDHTERADIDACTWEAGTESIIAKASVSSPEQRKELISALTHLVKAAATLKNRLNKEAGKGE